jgi:methyltransferase (TIGR00027 family)
MVAYLAARTSFFDRVVFVALENGMRQVVIAAAGYDGRALRYAKPGVRWFEVDHPDTQADKRARLERLGLEASHIAFVAAHFAVDDVEVALVGAGHQSEVPSLFLCEGVAIYLERSVLESLLHGLRQVACDGSRLAISLSVASSSAAQTVRRVAFRAAVAAMGEPARTVLSSGEVNTLLTTTGWRVAPSTSTSEAQPQRARLGGLLVLEPR